MTIFFVLLIAIALVGAYALVAIRSVPTDRDVAWLAGSLAADSAALDVCRRYLARHRRHRVVGGLFGVVFAAIVGVSWFSSISIGIGQGSPLADLLFCGLAGVIVGALSAESFRLSSTPGGRQAASLVKHPAAVRTSRIVLARLLVVSALGIAIVAWLTDHGATAFASSLVLIAPFGLSEAIGMVIAFRARPVMTDSARMLDDRLRAFASSSVSFLQLATAALMMGWVASKVDDLTGVLAFVQFCTVFTGLVGAVLMLHRAAPRAPRNPSHSLVDDEFVHVDDRSPVA